MADAAALHLRPLTVAVTRSGQVESVHRVSAAIVRGDVLLDARGDVDRPVFARSALKPLQALPLLARVPGIDEERIAIACGSHNGEPIHVQMVARWLSDIGLSPDALQCGAHPPIDADSAKALLLRNELPCAVHNNCSGKHCGFLHASLATGISGHGSLDRDHPLQQEVRERMAPFFGCNIHAAPHGVDGCGAPVYALPLRALARAFSLLAQPSALDATSRAAARRLFNAMTTHPYLVAGRDRFDTRAMECMPGRLVVKGGAEGIWAAGCAETGVGIAVKVHDGAKRASEAAIAGLLAHVLGKDAEGIPALATTDVRNAAGTMVGTIELTQEEMDW